MFDKQVNDKLKHVGHVTAQIRAYFPPEAPPKENQDPDTLAQIRKELFPARELDSAL